MATLQATTCTTLSGNIASPKTFITSTSALQEWSGSVTLENNATADIIGSDGYGYVWQVGTVHFQGAMSGLSNVFGIVDYSVSYYGLYSYNQLVSDWGGFSFSRHTTGLYDNHLRFTNTSGYSGTFYFTVTTTSFINTTSNILTRIK
jgi:hypothetical protein